MLPATKCTAPHSRTHGKAAPRLVCRYTRTAHCWHSRKFSRAQHNSSRTGSTTSACTTLQEARTSHVRHPMAVAVDDRAHGRRDGLGERLLSGVDNRSCCRPCCPLCRRTAALRPLRLAAAPTSSRAPVRRLALALGLGLGGALRLAGRSGLGRVHRTPQRSVGTNVLSSPYRTVILRSVDLVEYFAHWNREVKVWKARGANHTPPQHRTAID